MPAAAAEFNTLGIAANISEMVILNSFFN